MIKLKESGEVYGGGIKALSEADAGIKDKYKPVIGEMKSYFEENVDMYFQPVLDLKTGEVYGFEALSRIEGGTIAPLEFYELMRDEGKLFEADTLARIKAIEKSYSNGIFEKRKKLFLNVEPNSFMAFDFRKGVTVEALSKIGISPRNIIIEITENTLAEDHEFFKQVLIHYKEQGFRVAIDDFGRGFAGLKTFYDISPDIIKIDMFLIKDIHRDNVKKKIVQSIVNMCFSLGIETVAEGIEKEEEIREVRKIGFDYAQGFFISRPSPEPVFDVKIDFHSDEKESLTGIYLKNIIAHRISMNLQDNIFDLLKKFNENEKVIIIPIVENEKPIGIIKKREVDAVLRTPFGINLLTYKKVGELMSPRFVEASGEKKIENLAPFIGENSSRHKILTDGIVVVEQGKYVGVVNFYDLFEKLSQQVASLSLDLNPLTKLPGNRVIRTWLEALTKGTPFCIAYVDFDNFKSFNDCFGFVKGDIAIDIGGEELRKIERSMIGVKTGHVGGDDFVLVYTGTEKQRFVKKLEEAIKSFYKRRRALFDEKALSLGFYVSKDRKGRSQRFPLLTVSAGIISDENFGEKFDYIKLTDKLNEAKKTAKASKEIIFVDRRNQ